MKIQKLVLFLLCFLNCISSQCMEKEKKNLCLIYEPYSGANLNEFIRDITSKFCEIYKLKCDKSVENFKKQLSNFLRKDPVFLKDNPNIYFNISFELLMTKFATFYRYEKEITEGFLNRWKEFLDNSKHN